MTPTNKCQHDGEMKTGWDELTCKKCFWILPSGQRIGKHFGWFPSHEAHKEFKKYRTYTGMDNTYPIDTTKSAEAQNMAQNNEREAFESWFKTFMPETYSQHVNDEDIEATRQYHSAWLAWQARAQSPISQNEQQEAVGEVVNERGYSEVFVDFFDKPPPPNGTKLYTSPPKQIPDGWKPISEEQIEFIALQDKFWKGGFNNDMIDWMMFAKAVEEKLRGLNTVPTTSLTSETNTEVG